VREVGTVRDGSGEGIRGSGLIYGWLGWEVWAVVLIMRRVGEVYERSCWGIETEGEWRFEEYIPESPWATSCSKEFQKLGSQYHRKFMKARSSQASKPCILQAHPQSPH
jgi:hypothetical protein